MRRFFALRYLARYINIVLIGLVVAYQFHIKTKRSTDQKTKIIAELADLNAKWVQLRARQGELEYASQERDKVMKKCEGLKAEIVQMQQAVLEHKEAIELLGKQRTTLFFEYRKQMRWNAKGMKFSQIMTPQGKTYDNVEIIEVRPDGITFRHGAAGSASARGMALHELPAEWVKRFMYTEEEMEWVRAWTSDEGTKTIYGKFKSYDKDTGVVIIIEGSRKLSLNIDHLSEANREWLEKQALEGKAEVADILEELDKQVIGCKIKKGVLSKLEGDHFFDFTMSHAPDYYVVYYSASW